jgi:hypothetical protein
MIAVRQVPPVRARTTHCHGRPSPAAGVSATPAPASVTAGAPGARPGIHGDSGTRAGIA